MTSPTRRALVALTGAVVSSGCANFASLQEADVVAAGQRRSGAAMTYTSYKVRNQDETIGTVSTPALVFFYRAGVANRLEVHADAWLPLGASLGGKLQLLGRRDRPGLAVSLGLDVGALQITSAGGDGQDDERLTVVDIYVPLYLGARLGPAFAFYVTPKYIHRVFVGDSGDSAAEKMAGGTVGAAMGAKTTFLIEGTVMRDLDLEATAVQGSVGLAF